VEEHIGLIGCGLMGAPIAQRLVDHGYEVVVFDKSTDAMSRARDIGCETAATPAAVARRSRVVLISLPRPEHVVDVVRAGSDCLLDGAAAGLIIVDTSTVDPATSRDNAAAAADKGVGYLDCPILGRPSGVGRWTLPTGGQPEHIAAVTPVLETIAAKIIHIGPVGHGNMLKLLNNLMFGAINTITAEVFALGDRLGMDPGLLFDTIADSGAATVSNLFKELGPKIVEREFTPNFSINNLEKDVGLGLAMAQAAGMKLAFSEIGQEINKVAQRAGLGDEDTAALVKALTTTPSTTEH
jgi:3-hydroxyisobutyrate dehydrogenase-like beta-hydroxyacid dehydrogenase